MSVVVFANSITSGVSASAFDFIQIGSQIILPNQTVFVIATVQSIQAFKGGVPTTFLAEALVAPVPTTPLTIQGNIRNILFLETDFL